MTTIMVTGAFDLLHEGHKHLFKEAKQHGDRLIVVLARDLTILKEKGHKPLHNEQERLSAVRTTEGVDKAILGNEDDKLKILEDIRPDILALGYDQKMPIRLIKTYIKQHSIPTKIIKLHPHYPNIYKSSRLKRKI